MSLNFGFGLYCKEDESEFWKSRFNNLSEEQKDIYHNVLPWLMMAVDVNYISIDTIPIIIERSNIIKAVNIEMTKEILLPFVGFQTNVYFETTQQFIKKITKRFTKCSKADIEKIRQNTNKTSLKQQALQVDLNIKKEVA